MKCGYDQHFYSELYPPTIYVANMIVKLANNSNKYVLFPADNAAEIAAAFQ